MNEIEFKNWMFKKNINPKVQSDIISRLKKIEAEIDHCDIDEQYQQDDRGRGPALLRRRRDPGLGRYDGRIGPGGASVRYFLLPDTE